MNNMDFWILHLPMLIFIWLLILAMFGLFLWIGILAFSNLFRMIRDDWKKGEQSHE